MKLTHFISAALLLFGSSSLSASGGYAPSPVAPAGPDSLTTALHEAHDDSTRMRLHVEIADKLIFVNPDSSQYH